MNCGHEYKNEDCPNCGAKEGARMVNSEWGHSITCCSDKCGMEVAKKLKKNTSTKKYKKKLKKFYKLKEELHELRYSGIETDNTHFDWIDAL